MCKYKLQKAIKRCKHFELGGDKKRKVPSSTRNVVLFVTGPNDDLLNQCCQQWTFLHSIPQTTIQLLKLIAHGLLCICRIALLTRCVHAAVTPRAIRRLVSMHFMLFGGNLPYK